MKIKTSELISHALDYAVCIAIANPYLHWEEFSPSTRWDQGGPLVESEGIDLVKMHGQGWHAELKRVAHGPTPLIAAMRCYVASKLGEEVEIPKELK